MIETTAAGLAAQRRHEADTESIWRAVNACNVATSLVDQVSLDLAFHLAIVRAAGNPLVELMFRALQPYIVEILLRSLTDPVVARGGLAYHERIARAIEAHESALAAAEMQDHLTLGLTLFGVDIDRNLNLVARDALGRLVPSPVTLDDLLRLAQEG
jgi:DNA-binding FadR family transcriptional regulator